MNEDAKQYFDRIKRFWMSNIKGTSLYLLILVFLPLLLPWKTALMFLLLFPISGKMVYLVIMYFNYTKRKEYYRIKKLNPEDERLDELEIYFSNPQLTNWKCLFPWKPFQILFGFLFYGEAVPGHIHFLRLDLLRQILTKFYRKKVEEEKQKIDFDLLPYGIKSRFMEFQNPYQKYKLLHALQDTIFKFPQALIVVDNLELHFGEHPCFYSKWFYLRYLNCNNTKNLIIDTPWNSINDIFNYFLASFNDKFVLTFTMKINQNENYANFLPKIFPLNSIILSSLPSDSLPSTLKLCNIFLIKKLEIIESRLSKNDLEFLKGFKLESLLLNLSLCESYGIIDSFFETVHGIPYIRIDIAFSFYFKGYFELSAVKWVEKYGYPKNFVFIIKILDDFHIKFL